jgi:hypothetical protein
VLGEVCGYSREQIEKLRAAGVVGEPEEVT